MIAQPVHVGADIAKPSIDLYAAGLALAPSIENASAGPRGRCTAFARPPEFTTSASSPPCRRQA
jgi:hypothetical protein